MSASSASELKTPVYRPAKWWIAAGVALGLLVGGAFLGWSLGRLLSNDPSAPRVGFVTLPTVLGLGFSMWRWVALVVVMGRLSRLFLKPLERPASAPPPLRGPKPAPPGSSIFVPVGTCVGFLAGGWIGFQSGSPLLALGACSVLGAAYGAALWRLALLGYLPFPEQEWRWTLEAEATRGAGPRR